MKKVGKMLPIVAGILISSSAVALELPKNVTTPPDLLTGDVRLACEAILCLSSNQRPPECDPSIQRYYSIKHKKWQDTLRARQNFSAQLARMPKKTANLRICEITSS